MAGIYIHIPFCTSKCRYCDFTSYPGKIGFAEAYMACVSFIFPVTKIVSFLRKSEFHNK